MIRTLSAASFALIALTITATADEPLIVIDRWGGVDYAKARCEIPILKPVGESEETCEQESVEEYNIFELEFKTEFAAAPECGGLTLTSFGYPTDPKVPPPDLSRPYWSFSINYELDKSEQLWQMLTPNKSKLMQAAGTPAEIARQVCTIIKGNGGLVR